MSIDVNTEALLDKAYEALRRDLNHIFSMASTGKLNPMAARDLANYIRLLRDMEKAQLGELDGLSKDELEALAKSQALRDPDHT